MIDVGIVAKKEVSITGCVRVAHQRIRSEVPSVVGLTVNLCDEGQVMIGKRHKVPSGRTDNQSFCC